ncbi:MAG: PKD domain-containing protein [Candidatus Sericytochromatia bacterium]
MKKTQTSRLFAAALFSLSLTLTACDSPSSLSSTRQENALVRVRANYLPGQSAASAPTIQIPDPSQLPENLRNATQLRAIFDTSRSTVNVQRASDGSLSFPLSTGRSFSSGSTLQILLVGDDRYTYPVLLETGTPFQLATPAVSVAPASTVTLGTRTRLQANFTAEAEPERYLLGWEVGPSAAGPWQGVSGSTPSVEWEPRQAGSYYVRLQITDTQTRTQSSYTTPSPLVYVQTPDRLATVSPSSGAIVSGQEVQLSVALPEYAENAEASYQWFQSTSAQGPFQPIVGSGRSLSWEPPSPGSYYLQLQVQQDGRLSTYTSAQPEVLVSSGEDQIVTQPSSGSIVRGEAVTLSSAVSGLAPDTSYTWFYAFSPQGPFQPIAGSGASVEWLPPTTGEFYIRLRTFEPGTGNSQTYTSGTPEVSVRDSNAIFGLSPNPANLRKGDSVQLTLNDATNDNVSWAYASNPQAGFQSIPGSGRTLSWTPPDAGSFYLRATTTRPDGSVTNFTSANALVFVSERANVITTAPSLGNVSLGQPVRLSTDVVDPGAALRYSWSYATSLQGTFQPLQTLESNTQSTVTWYPPQAGSYFIKVDVSNPRSQSTLSFNSQEPIVRVTETTPFFSTDPANGRVEPNDNVLVRAAFDTGNRNFNFGWAYSTSTAGPFIPIGGSSGPEVRWEDPKPLGSYFIRLQATAPGSERSLTFLSAYPVVFVSRDSESSGDFGTSSTAARGSQILP